MQMPPWKLPQHKTQSGTLTHWSKGGGGASMLRFEDQKGIEHLELSNTYGNTYLNMGYLMHQGSGSQRGYGFELRTDLWGSIRADKGLLITTYNQDFTSRVSVNNPDGFEHMGATLANTASLMQEAGQAVSSAQSTIGALNQAKSSQIASLGSAIAAITGGGAGGAASLAKMASALSGGGGGGAETAMPTDTDPAMADARTSATTPTISRAPPSKSRRGGAFGRSNRSDSTLSAMRLPIGLSLGQNWRAIVSLMTTTRCAVASSVRSRTRPRRSCIDIAAKYPGVTET